MIMKTRLLALVCALLAATVLAVPAASAAARYDPDTAQGSYFCLNTDDHSYCLHQPGPSTSNCDVDESVVMYAYTDGGACTSDWDVAFEGDIPKSAGGTIKPPFYCGDDFNAKYEGDPIFQVTFSPSTGGIYVPESAGGGSPVDLTPYVENANPTNSTDPYQGYWVMTSSNTTDTTMVDVAASCATGVAQYVYASCLADGCTVNEGPDPASLLFWDWWNNI
jgi:hypothetical protein